MKPTDSKGASISTWRAMRIEHAKLAGLRIPLLGLLVTGAGVLFACANLFSATGRTAMTDPGKPFWEPHLIGYVMATSLITPVLAALLGSRVVDVENTGNGWGLFTAAGLTPGRQCRIKWLTLAPLICSLRAMEMAAVIVVPLAMGARSPEHLGAWILLGVQATGTTLALLALHICLAARSESQLLGIGIGISGALIAVLSLLAPPWLAAFTPWGYYALLLPYTFTPTGVGTITPAHPLWAGYILLAGLAFWALTRHLDAENT